jgi:hypothetical protein
MRRWFASLAVYAGVFLLPMLMMAGCGRGGPKAGETVTPVLAGPLSWQAGQTQAGLLVRLEARAANGAARLLAFDGIPTQVNPLATLRFEDASGTPLDPPVVITLDHRC